MTHVVIGVGNATGVDDGVGLAVAARLRGRAPAGVEIVECEQEPSRLIDAWDGADSALVVDAVESVRTPGRCTASTPAQARFPKESSARRHTLSAWATRSSWRASSASLPGQVVVYGVEGDEFAAGEGLTARVEAAIEPAARAILDDLERLTREEEPCTSER